MLIETEVAAISGHLSHRERSTREARRVRGYGLPKSERPHPNPLPTGEGAHHRCRYGFGPTFQLVLRFREHVAAAAHRDDAVRFLGVVLDRRANARNVHVD